MQLFDCGNCGQLLYFENVRCERCGSRLGFRDDRMRLEALASDPAAPDLWRPVRSGKDTFRLCSNARYDACNWLVPAQSDKDFCTACQLNRTIPDLNDSGRVMLWQRLEEAKHRLVYGLMRLGLPIVSKWEDRQHGLAFDFLADPDPGAFLDETSQTVMTGHAQGIITINIAEADDAEREKRRRMFAEPYRTLLGHFRHESGHYYWERLIADDGRTEEFRSIFGDERIDYEQALAHYYSYEAPKAWDQEHVTAYAATHPWEDWAECWAHYLHMVDTLETAHNFGLRLRPHTDNMSARASAADFDPYVERDFDNLLQTWLPLVYAVNSLNRSMGQPDLYPFVLARPVIEKLRFIHRLIRETRTLGAADPRVAAGTP